MADNKFLPAIQLNPDNDGAENTQLFHSLIQAFTGIKREEISNVVAQIHFEEINFCPKTGEVKMNGVHGGFNFVLKPTDNGDPIDKESKNGNYPHR